MHSDRFYILWVRCIGEEEGKEGDGMREREGWNEGERERDETEQMEIE